MLELAIKTGLLPRNFKVLGLMKDLANLFQPHTSGAGLINLSYFSYSSGLFFSFILLHHVTSKECQHHKTTFHIL